MRPGRARDLDLDDSQDELFKHKGPVDGRLPLSPEACSWEPLKVMERGKLQDRAGGRQQTRSGSKHYAALGLGTG